MKKIKRLERRREAIERGEELRESDEDIEDFEEEVGRQQSYPAYRPI